MDIDHLLSSVEDLTMYTTGEQLESKLAECQTAYDQLARSKVDRERADLLHAAIAKMQNKVVAMKAATRPQAQRAIKAAAATPPDEPAASDVEPKQ